MALRTEALRAILDHRDMTVIGGDGTNGFHIGQLAVQADWHDRPGSIRDARRDQAGIDIAGVRFDIHKYGPGTKQCNHLGAGGKGERAGDDLIPGTNPQGHQGNQQRLGAAGHRYAVLHVDKARQRLLQLGNLRPHDVLAVRKHRSHPAVQFGLDRLLLRLQINELHIRSL